MNIYGIEVTECPFAFERKQCKFPRSKKKRIREKWSKRPKNFVEKPLALKIGNQIIVHPIIFRQITLDLKQKTPYI